MSRRGVAAGFFALLALASVALTACGNGQGATRASGFPTQSDSSVLGRLAYVLDGSIYVKDLPDGEAVRLVEGASPSWSPSGRWLVFSSGNSNWVIRADGSDRRPLPNWALSDDPRVVPSGVAAWSPTADVIAYATDGAFFVEDANGSDARQVVTLESCPQGLAWSPDGTRLAYDQQVTVEPQGKTTGGSGGRQFPINRRAELWVASVESGKGAAELYATTTDGILVAGWTADGAYVLFWRDIQFSASMMADGLPLEAVPAQGGRSLALAAGHLALWAPSPVDGRIAMTEAGRDTYMRKRIFLVDVSGGEPHYLTPEDRASIQPAWSPDGTRIAFVSKPAAGDGAGGPGWKLEDMVADRRIWVMNADGNDQRPLTDDVAYRDEHPLWSADGSQILFARLDGGRHASLWLMSSGGGNAREVVEAIGSSAEGLTGYYTNIGWGGMFDWWQLAPE